MIDRFGRVFRIVHESDIANHAGLSVWGDERGAYVNLNASFLEILDSPKHRPRRGTASRASWQ